MADEITCEHCDTANPAGRKTCRRCRRVLVREDPALRALHARIAVHTSWQQTTNRTARTAPAVEAGPSRLSYWEKRVDPDGLMDEATRAKAAENARTAHYQRMAYRSAQARARRKAAAS